jgi:hypothetical protein
MRHPVQSSHRCHIRICSRDSFLKIKLGKCKEQINYSGRAQTCRMNFREDKLHEMLIGKPERKKSTEKPRCIVEHYVRMDLK